MYAPQPDLNLTSTEPHDRFPAFLTIFMKPQYDRAPFRVHLWVVQAQIVSCPQVLQRRKHILPALVMRSADRRCVPSFFPKESS